MKCGECGKVLGRNEIDVIAENFRSTGRYYSGGCVHVQRFEVLTPRPGRKNNVLGPPRQHFDIIDEVRKLIEAGKTPGLCDGPPRFIVHLRIPKHPHDCPTLIVPEGALT